LLVRRLRVAEDRDGGCDVDVAVALVLADIGVVLLLADRLVAEAHRLRRFLYPTQDG
jgi:hypothetical protein